MDILRPNRKLIAFFVFETWKLSENLNSILVFRKRKFKYFTYRDIVGNRCHLMWNQRNKNILFVVLDPTQVEPFCIRGRNRRDPSHMEMFDFFVQAFWSLEPRFLLEVNQLRLGVCLRFLPHLRLFRDQNLHCRNLEKEIQKITLEFL